MSQQIWNKITIAHPILSKHRGQWRRVCIYPYAGGTPSVLECLSSSDGIGGIPGRRATVPLRQQRVCALFAVRFWQGRQPSIWFLRTIAGCLSMAVFTLLCQANSTPRFFSSQTSARGFFISCCVCSIAVRGNPPSAILVIFKARLISECSSCTRPPCLAIVADMLKTSKKLVATSKVRFGYYLNHIRLCRVL